MRDIRQDLRERLDEIAIERAKLDARERALRDELRVEEHRWSSGPEQGTLFAGKQNGKSKSTPRKRTLEPTEKTKFLLETLADRRPWPIELLVNAAEERRIPFEGKSPKRVLHFVLLGMMQRGIVEKIGENEWMLRHPPEGGDVGVSH